MAPIRILHASDLHLSHDPRRRSILDKFDDGVIWTLRRAASAFKGVREALADLVERATSNDPEIVEELAEFIINEARTGRLHGVVLTGDLATTGDQEDVDAVSDLFNAEPNPRKPHIGKSTKKGTLSALPASVKLKYFAGNHDRFISTFKWGVSKGPLPFWQNGRLLLPKIFDVGGKNIDGLLADGREAVRPVPVDVAYVQQRSANGRMLTIYVLMADFSLLRFEDHDRHFGWIAQGKVDGKILESLEEQTRIVIDSQKPDMKQRIIWACHFPPQFAQQKEHSRLLDADKLVSAANKLGVSIVLSGHTHDQVSYNRPGMHAEVLCCGTTTQWEPRSHPGGADEADETRGNHFQILEFDELPNGAVTMTLEHYRYTHTFVDDLGNVHNGPQPGENRWKLISRNYPKMI